MCKLPLCMLIHPFLIIIILAATTPVQSLKHHHNDSDQQSCTAGLIFLKTFEKHHHHNNNTDAYPIDTSNQPLNKSSSPNTYTIQITYPCSTSPLKKIEKLKKSIPDPFISFYLTDKKKNLHKRAKRSPKHLSEYEGSGDYDDDDDDDDEEEDDDEEDDEDIRNEHDDANEIIDDPSIILFPSNHVMISLPTPSFTYEDNYVTHGYSNPVEVPSSALPPPSQPSIRLLQSINPTIVASSLSPQQSPDSDDLLVFPNSAGGSGDGPILSTPLYNPSSSESPTLGSSPVTTERFVSSSSPTPELPMSHLLHPIQKQLIYSGSPHTFNIPHNTFHPPCSGYELLESSAEAPWIQVKSNASNSVVHFFPTTRHISDYKLVVQCKPYGTTAEMFVSVRQRQRSRLHNHEFVLEFGMLRGDLGRVELLNKVVDEVRAALRSNGSNDLVVLTTELESYPFRVSYVNESIISNVCPVGELKGIYEELRRMIGVDGFIKLEAVRLVIPQDNNQCEGSVVQVVTGGSTTNHLSHDNYPPSIKNQIDRLNGTVGEYLVYHVREDFCYDPEDGGTRNLRVELRSNEMAEIDEAYWLQFDGKNQEFYGLPMGVERREFVLVCSDKGGKSANDVLELQILPPKTPPSDYYTEFNLNFQSIPFTPKATRKFIEKLSSLLSPHIQVNSYSESNNHVLFKYFNTTNPSTEHDVTEIRKVLLSDDGPVNKRLFDHFTPEFNVSVVSVVPLRGLLSENNPVVVVDGGGGVVVEDTLDGDYDQHERGGGGSSKKGGGGGGGRYFDFDSGESNVRGGGGGGKLDIENIVNVDSYSGYLTTYIIPSVLIAIMILLALIIACLLSRKNKYTQASTEDDSSSPNSRAYLKNAKKGVPVIFQDELDEKLFGNNGEGGREQRAGGGNIYEHNAPSSQPQPPQHHQPLHSATTTPQNTTPSRLTSPTPSSHHHQPNSRYNTNNNTPHHHQSTPQPPDYQNSISRSMMRNRGGGAGHYSGPPGGIQVYPPSGQQHYQVMHHNDPYRSPPSIHHQQQQYPIDSYQPPPGINYYGIHNSNSGGSGFSERTTASGIIGGGQQHYQQQQQPHHYHHGGMGGGGSTGTGSKMAPPPYVPP